MYEKGKLARTKSLYRTSALRTPTREQVERMRGEWKPIERLWKYSHQWNCTKCGHPVLTNKKNFCENCGAPMTDEAVDMMLERWKEANSND